MTLLSESNRLLLRRACVIAAFSVLVAAGDADAQISNAEVLQRLAVECVAPDFSSTDRLTLRSDGRYPFLDQAVIGALRTRVGDVYFETAADTTAAERTKSTMAYFVLGSSIRYEGRGRQLERLVALNLGYILQDPDGRVAADSTCTKTFRDNVSRSSLESIEDESIPITRGVRPRRSWIRRYAEPVVVGAATAVAVYLFFSVRSDANDSP